MVKIMIKVTYYFKGQEEGVDVLAKTLPRVGGKVTVKGKRVTVKSVNRCTYEMDNGEEDIYYAINVA